jgi:glucokinase
MRCLAADIGGTYSRLAWSRDGTGADEATQVFDNAEFDSLDAVIERGLAALGAPGQPIEHMVLAVPGPIHSDPIRLTNIDWSLDRERLRARFAVDRLTVVNDFQAAAHGISLLVKEDLICLNDVPVEEEGLSVITGAGTGLGLALMGKCAHLLGRAVHPTEAGHADYAPANEQQLRLSNYLHETLQMEKVSWEKLLSGHGLVLLDAFLRGQDRPVLKTPETVTAGAERQDITARHAIRLFWDLYAAWAGNVALMYRPLGGLYLFGGMAMRLRPWFEPERFMQEAASRAEMQELVRETPIFLVTDEQLALKGAAVAVKEMFY